MNDTPANLVSASLQDVFGERDPDTRHGALARIYAPDVQFFDAEGEVRGLPDFEAKIAGLLQSAPGDWVFQASGAAQQLGDLGRAGWTFGPPAGPAAVSGTDIALVADGLIQRMYTFLDQR